MKIPDETIFGHDNKNSNIDFRFVRTIKEDDAKIDILQLRLKKYFENQVEPLVKANSAFPLTVLTCLGIETLGEIFFEKSIFDSAKRFTNACFELDPIFKPKPSKQTLQKMNEVWSSDKMKGVKSIAHVVHNFLRNAMIHGYSAQAIYLSYEDTQNFLENKEYGIFVINPNWFWDRYKYGSDKLFNMAKSKTNHKQKRKCCLEYFNKLID